MLVSRGALNGAVLNELALNAGGFLVPLSVASGVAITGGARLTPRRTIRVAASASIAGIALVTPRRSVRVQGVTDVDGIVRLTPRRPVSAVGGIRLACEALVTRRVVAFAAGRMNLRGSVHVRWRDFGRIADRRRIVVDPAPRLLVSAAQDRAYEVRPDRLSAAAAQKRVVSR